MSADKLVVCIMCKGEGVARGIIGYATSHGTGSINGAKTPIVCPACSGTGTLTDRTDTSNK